MKLEELENLYKREFDSGHLVALQAIFNAGVKSGEEEAWRGFQELERQKELAMRTFGKEAEIPAIMRQVLEMGRSFTK